MNTHDIPDLFRRCVATGCAAAERCLRYQAFEASSADDASFWCINPKAARPEEGEACPHFCIADAEVAISCPLRVVLRTLSVGAKPLTSNS